MPNLHASGRQESYAFLVGGSITLLNDGFVLIDFALKVLEYIKDVGTAG